MTRRNNTGCMIVSTLPVPSVSSYSTQVMCTDDTTSSSSLQPTPVVVLDVDSTAPLDSWTPPGSPTVANSVAVKKAIRCGKCGQVKKDHTCTWVSGEPFHNQRAATRLQGSARSNFHALKPPSGKIAVGSSSAMSPAVGCPSAKSVMGGGAKKGGAGSNTKVPSQRTVLKAWLATQLEKDRTEGGEYRIFWMKRMKELKPNTDWTGMGSSTFLWSNLSDRAVAQLVVEEEWFWERTEVWLREWREQYGEVLIDFSDQDAIGNEEQDMYSGIERLEVDEDDESGANVPSHTVRKGVGDD
eukprot:CAMPEP_0179479096 /NCGR_PEP_ID=MMETSP0799-20121207/57409_1 /TAXON_ID=46947 /ORGANISM="Geminigera cryophila, Strain CCMP2564" /LENGTH=297 /DNA_ID=CAMNT_0021290531 /DNA_START=198 /DNA_END=1091 /DNA_ORIENTATION=-